MLPSLNFNIDLTDDVKLRAAASETIARQGYGSLIGGTNAGGAGNRSGYSATTGNPALRPLQSINLDLSVEWYYDAAS